VHGGVLGGRARVGFSNPTAVGEERLVIIRIVHPVGACVHGPLVLAISMNRGDVVVVLSAVASCLLPRHGILHDNVEVLLNLVHVRHLPDESVEGALELLRAQQVGCHTGFVPVRAYLQLLHHVTDDAM
jgi:hypothetical protein